MIKTIIIINNVFINNMNNNKFNSLINILLKQLILLMKKSNSIKYFKMK